MTTSIWFFGALFASPLWLCSAGRGLLETWMPTCPTHLGQVAVGLVSRIRSWLAYTRHQLCDDHSNLFLNEIYSLKFSLLYNFPREVILIWSGICNHQCELSFDLFDVLKHLKAQLHWLSVIAASVLDVQHDERLYPIPIVIARVRRTFNPK